VTKARPPAPDCTTTSRPAAHSRATASGTRATRRSPGRVSMGTATLTSVNLNDVRRVTTRGHDLDGVHTNRAPRPAIGRGALLVGRSGAKSRETGRCLTRDRLSGQVRARVAASSRRAVARRPRPSSRLHGCQTSCCPPLVRSVGPSASTYDGDAACVHRSVLTSTTMPLGACAGLAVGLQGAATRLSRRDRAAQRRKLVDTGIRMR